MHAPELPLTKLQRDLRLDLFRGLANWGIFLGHISNTVLAWFTTRNYGFSDGADLFVFVSGYTATLVYARMMMERGFVIGATRLLRRTGQLYIAHVLLFVFYLTSVHYLSHSWDIPHLMDQFNVRQLIDRPVETLTEGLLLKFKPLNLDVLPLYIVLIGLFAPVLRVMISFPNAVMTASFVLYAAARMFGWNLPSFPSGTWYFNPFTWQLIFVLGGWLALGGAQVTRPIVQCRLARAICFAYLTVALVISLSSQVSQLRLVVPDEVFILFTPNDKTNLAPYRVLHLLALVLLTVHYMPADWPGLKSSLLEPLIKCGQQSLEVFCAGVFLAFIAHFVLLTTVDTAASELLVGVAGLAIITAVAYYRSWSKAIEKPAKCARSQA